jgi:hypothetical protein
MFLGSNLVSWSARKQCTVSHSSNVDTNSYQRIAYSSPRPAKLRCDNLGAKYLIDNVVFHARTKHIEADYHFVRERL